MMVTAIVDLLYFLLWLLPKLQGFTIQEEEKSKADSPFSQQSLKGRPRSSLETPGVWLVLPKSVLLKVLGLGLGLPSLSLIVWYF